MSTVNIEDKKKARTAVVVWVAVLCIYSDNQLVLPLVFKWDLNDWTYSVAKGLLLFSIVYAGFFIVVPLTLTKGWGTIKKLGFFLPMAAAMVSVVFWYHPLHCRSSHRGLRIHALTL